MFGAARATFEDLYRVPACPRERDFGHSSTTPPRIHLTPFCVLIHDLWAPRRKVACRKLFE